MADRLLKHHRGFGGVSYVYVNHQGELPRVQAFFRDLPGVDDALTRPEAGSRFHLMPERIGDLVVMADRDTVFGDLAGSEEALAVGYRNHGSLYEQDIPLILYGYDGTLPFSEEMQMNFDLTRWLCRTML